MPSNKHSNHSGKKRHRHSEVMSNPAFSYYSGNKVLHFYRWNSPPGVMKIMCIIIIIMCVAVFACVASTLAWDYEMSLMGGGTGLMPGSYGSGYGTGYGGAYGGSYGGSYGGGYGGSYSGYGGTQMDPRSGKGFIIAISAITFIAVLIIFIMVVSRQAQSTGSMYYNQVVQMCAQFQNQVQPQGLFLNQYLYHYCVVEPQEAIAVVMGFLVFVALIILLVFAVKTRQQIRRWGPERILWEEVKVVNVGHHNSVGEWVTNVSGDPEVFVNDHNDKVGASTDYLDQLDYNKPLYLPGDSDISSYVGGLQPRLRDYDTGVESGDDLEEEDFSVLFPPILDEQERLAYKQEFDRDHQEYKNLQAELDSINQDLADLDRELDRHSDGSPEFMDALSDYNRLKDFKKSSEYQIKKKRCKYLRSKLSHIKRKISEYDRRP
uniref:Occludin b n=1 Tax=Astatotilapia calliptera TaxID=8154 RepID=A0A3P8NVL3_ASTCA